MVSYAVGPIAEVLSLSEKFGTCDSRRWSSRSTRRAVIARLPRSRPNLILAHDRSGTESLAIYSEHPPNMSTSCSQPETTALVVGGGLVGTLCAAMLASRGWTVTLVESRSDPRKVTHGSARARSINLALSPRGIEALKSVSVELADRVIREGLPMRGRMLHTSDDGGRTKKLGQDYGFVEEGEVINSISRGQLGNYLLDHVDTLPSEGPGSVRVLYETKLLEMDLRREDGVSVTLGSKARGEEQLKFDLIIGGDGAYSRVRREMMRGSKTR